MATVLNITVFAEREEWQHAEDNEDRRADRQEERRIGRTIARETCRRMTKVRYIQCDCVDYVIPSTLRRTIPEDIMAGRPFHLWKDYAGSRSPGTRVTPRAIAGEVADVAYLDA